MSKQVLLKPPTGNADRLSRFMYKSHAPAHFNPPSPLSVLRCRPLSHSEATTDWSPCPSSLFSNPPSIFNQTIYLWRPPPHNNTSLPSPSQHLPPLRHRRALTCPRCRRGCGEPPNLEVCPPYLEAQPLHSTSKGIEIRIRRPQRATSHHRSSMW